MNEHIKQRITQLNNGEAPSGYKKTEFGVFPCDWSPKTIGEVSTEKGCYGLNAPACDYEEGLPKYLRITDIDENGNYLNNDAYVNHKDSKNYMLQENDIVFARTGASVGKNYLYSSKDGELSYAGFLIKFSIDETKCVPYMVKANCRGNRYDKWVQITSARSGQPGINAEEYADFSLMIPNDLKEQSKIAEILMKWDEAIELQEQYIGTLENRKKFLMKKLLTSKGNWRSVKLGKIAEMYAGGTPSTQKSEYWGGEIPWIQSGLIQNGYIDIENIDGRITEEGLKKSSATWIAKNSVLVAITGATCANIAYLRCDATANQSVISITTNTVDSLFLYFYLQSTRNKLLSLQNGSAQGGLTLKYLQNFEIMYPELSVQKKIGSILSNVDVEISMQKDIVLKLKNQRKALQQYLLNGIVRVNK